MSASNSSCGAVDACAAGAGVTGSAGCCTPARQALRQAAIAAQNPPSVRGAGWGWVWRSVLLARLDSGSMPNVPPGPMLTGSSGSSLTAFGGRFPRTGAKITSNDAWVWASGLAVNGASGHSRCHRGRVGGLPLQGGRSLLRETARVRDDVVNRMVRAAAVRQRTGQILDALLPGSCSNRRVS